MCIFLRYVYIVRLFMIFIKFNPYDERSKVALKIKFKKNIQTTAFKKTIIAATKITFFYHFYPAWLHQFKNRGKSILVDRLWNLFIYYSNRHELKI